MTQYYEFFKYLLYKIKTNSISKSEIEDFISRQIDFEFIYNSKDTLLTDIFFSLRHFASNEEGLTLPEIEYFLKCLNGNEKHSFENKMLYCKSNKL